MTGIDTATEADDEKTISDAQDKVDAEIAEEDLATGEN